MTRLLLLFLGPMVWPFAGLVVIQATVFSADLAVTKLNPPSILVLMLPYFWVALGVGARCVLGATAPVWVCAPLAAAIGFLAPLLLSANPDAAAALLSAIDDGAIEAPIVLRNEALAAQVLLLTVGISVSFAVLAISGHALRTTKSRRLALLGVGLLGTWWFMTLAVVDPTRREVATQAAGPRVCTANVCVWSDHGPLLQPATTVWENIWSSLPKTVEAGA